MNDFPWLTAADRCCRSSARSVTALLPAPTALLPKQVGARLRRWLTLRRWPSSIAAGYDAGGGMQFTEQHEWIEAFGAHYALGVDGLGLLMVLLTAVLVPIVMLASWHDGRRRPQAGDAFFAWMLALEALVARRSSPPPTCSSSTSCSRPR